MRTTRRRARGRRGFTFIEVLVAGVLLCIGVMGLVNLWLFSFRVTTITDEKAIAYNLGRQAVEQTRMAGFSQAAEGTSTAFYNGNQAPAAQGSAGFKVTVSVVSDQVKSGLPGVSGSVPGDYALRAVVVTVTKPATGQALYQTTTYLVRAGT